MAYRPIGPTAHGAIDYGFLTMNLLAPTLFGLTGTAKALCYGMAASQGGLNALTDHPLGVAKVVPLKTHGDLETSFVPGILLLPLLAGALKQRNARLYFGSFFAVAAATYLLTNFNAYDPLSPPPTWQRALGWAESELE